VWQETAFRLWLDRIKATTDVPTQHLLEGLSIEQQVGWLRRLERLAHPVADGMAGWLSGMVDSRRWRAVAGDGWDIADDDTMVLISYPEYLAWDPLAMCAMGALWAGKDSIRWSRVVEFLGPVVILGASAGELISGAVLSRLATFQSYYSQYNERWQLGVIDQKWQRPNSAESIYEPWGEVPDYEDYREQLAFGVVPHEVPGSAIRSEIAALLALHEMPNRDRPMMAGLTYKALEGRWMMAAWQKAR